MLPSLGAKLAKKFRKAKVVEIFLDGEHYKFSLESAKALPDSESIGVELTLKPKK